MDRFPVFLLGLVPSYLTTILEPTGNSRCRVLVDQLGFGVLLQAGRAQLAANTGLTKATPLGLWQVGAKVVNPDGAVTQTSRHTLRNLTVGCPHRTGQAVFGVVTISMASSTVVKVSTVTTGPKASS